MVRKYTPIGSAPRKVRKPHCQGRPKKPGRMSQSRRSSPSSSRRSDTQAATNATKVIEYTSAIALSIDITNDSPSSAP